MSELAQLHGPGWSVLPDGNCAELPEAQGKHKWSPLQFILGDYPELQKGEIPFLLERFSLFGPVFKVKLGPNTFTAVLQHDTIKTLLQHGDGKVMSFWSPPALEAFTSAESKANMETPAARMAQRKTLAPGFSRQALRQVLSKVETICRRKLEAWSVAGQAIDLTQEGRELSFDFSAELLVDFDVPSEQRADIKAKLDAMFKAMVAPPVPFPGTTFSKGIKAQRELREEIKRIIELREKSSAAGAVAAAAGAAQGSSAAGSSAFELILQALRENQSKDGMLSADTIAQSGISLLLAGTDTSGGGLTATLAMLSLFPEVMQKLRQEQQQVLPQFGPNFSLHALDAMPYAEAVIKEALRLAPPAGVVMRKTLVDLEIHGKFVPAGSLLYLSTFTAMNLNDAANLNAGHGLSSMDPQELQQLSTNWRTISHGLLQQEFRPERWLKEPPAAAAAAAGAGAAAVGAVGENDDGSAVAKKSSGLLTFSVGPHTCLGMSLYFVEVKVLLALLARGYEIKTESPKQLEFSMSLLAQLVSNGGSCVRFVQLPAADAAAAAAGGVGGVGVKSAELAAAR